MLLNRIKLPKRFLMINVFQNLFRRKVQIQIMYMSNFRKLVWIKKKIFSELKKKNVLLSVTSKFKIFRNSFKNSFRHLGINPK